MQNVCCSKWSVLKWPVDTQYQYSSAVTDVASCVVAGFVFAPVISLLLWQILFAPLTVVALSVTCTEIVNQSKLYLYKTLYVTARL
jgi:hypothetical protein